ncbi:3-oxoacyl-[acyl-carrier-protein] synthase-3 [Streptomyces sp. SAI-170]|uniref:beta-ketoacyl-ACP synthase III n=1 Tax=Streptomyces sp. SAI-170 TaxID=3377729 RepID=UPI003C79A13E
MNPAGGPSAVLTGLGTCLPDTVVTNHELASALDTSDTWIRSRTGIHRRHLVDPGTATSDLAVEAGARALKSSGRSSVDCVVLATTTPDHPCPATAPQVAARLGLSGVPAFDVSAVCTGFLYGMAAAQGLIAAGTAERVLLIASETFSRLIDPTDRTTAPIFGDGAGAVVLRAGTPDEAGAVGTTVLGSDGDRADLIVVDAGGSRQRTSRRRADHFLRMDGPQLFRQAVERMAQATSEALHLANWQIRDLDRLLTHQANARITAAVAERLHLPADRCPSNIAQIGNTAGASLPLLLAHAVRTGQLHPGHRVALAAFGAGLTWGSTTLCWPELTVLEDMQPQP